MRCPPSSLHPPFVHLEVNAVIPHCVGPTDSIAHRHGGILLLRPRGPRSGSGYSVPIRHHLMRPHPPHSRAHRDFTAWRLIRDAFAVRERLGDPRAVPGFRCSFLPDMPSSMTPGSSIIVSVQNTDVDIGLRHGPGLRTRNNPAIRFTRGTVFAVTLVRDCYGPSGCWPPYGSDRSPSQRKPLLPGLRRVNYPSRRLIYNYNSVCLVCWRDFHRRNGS